MLSLNALSLRHWITKVCTSTRSLGTSALVGTVVLAGAMQAGLAPEPAPVPTRWQLDIEPGPMRLISVDVPKTSSAAGPASSGGPQMFLYMSYRVINNSGQDVLFAPAFELSNGEGDITRSGRDVPQVVTDKVVAALQNPLVQDQISIIGELMQGKENGRDGVVIWPLLDTNPQSLVVYAAGFSGETATVDGPEKNGQKQKFVLRKTLMLDFAPPGSFEGQRSDAIPLAGQSWIMR